MNQLASARNPIAYELSFLQFSPDPTQGEWLSIGVAALAADGEFWGKVSERSGRIRAAFPRVVPARYRALARVLNARSHQLQARHGLGSPRLMPEQRNLRDFLDAIVGRRNDSLRWSEPWVGICRNLSERATAAFDEIVDGGGIGVSRPRIDDDAIWRTIADSLSHHDWWTRLSPQVTLSSVDYSYTFRAGWRNGRQHVLEPISLDYLAPTDMVEEATRWLGRLAELSRGGSFRMTAVLTDPPAGEGRVSYDKACSILNRAPSVSRILPVSDADELEQIVATESH